MENPKFTMFYATSGYYWRLRSKNGEIILSSESYSSKLGCRNGIQSVKENAPFDQRYEKKTALNYQYYFVLKALNYEILGRSEMYSSTASREDGISCVKRDAPTAPIEDLT